MKNVLAIGSYFSTRKRPTELLLLAVWFALIVGFAELAVLAVRKFILDQMLFVGPQVIWMTPLSYVLFFVGIGLVLQGIAWKWPRLVSLRTTVFLFTFLAAFSFLFLWYPRLHKLAILFLALGLAVQAARLSATRAEGVQRLVGRTVGWMAGLVLVMAVGLHGWRALVEHGEMAKLAPARAQAPNVLLIVLDTVRAQSLSVYGYQRPTTPQLEKLAKRGVRFERAISTAPWTAPAHASMFTGRWPHELSTDWKTMHLKPLDATHPTLAEVLGARGYATAGFVANVEMAGYETGLSRGFTHYEDYPVSAAEVVLSSSLGRLITMSPKLRSLVDYYDVPSRKTAANINEAFLDWQAGQPGRPFFAFLNYFDAHEPYLPPQPFDSMFGPVSPRKNHLTLHLRAHLAKREDKDEMSPQEIQAEVDAYESAIAYMDHQLGHLFDELEKRKILDNTVVIITSDHGEQFGEHGLFEHVNSLYLPLLHVPLLISYPDAVPAGLSVSEPVSLRNLPSTVGELVGLKESVSFPGGSLSRFWSNTPESRSLEIEPLLSEVEFMPGVPESWPIIKGDMKSLVLSQYHYIKNGDGREELYDWKTDPGEERDLAASVEGRQILVSFRENLDTILVNDRTPRQNTAKNYANKP